MQFNEKEIRFLMTSQQVENSIGGNRRPAEAVDLREIGCPPQIFNRILEQRARKLGNKFAEFRAQNQYHSPSQPDLTDRLTAAKLF
jgi:hypothetical protein